MGNINSIDEREDGALEIFSLGSSTTITTITKKTSEDDLHFKELQEPLRQHGNTNTVGCVGSTTCGIPEYSANDARRYVSVMKQQQSVLNVGEQTSYNVIASVESNHLSNIRELPRRGSDGSSYTSVRRGHNKIDPIGGERVEYISSNTSPILKSISFVSTKEMEEERQSASELSLRSGDSSIRKRESLPSLQRASPSSPHTYKLMKKEVINQTMQGRLNALRKSFRNTQVLEDKMEKDAKAIPCDTQSNEPDRMTKAKRNRRRAEHNQAIIDDLCEIVTDLFISERSLFVGNDGLDESQVGLRCNKKISVMKSVRQFLSDLPIRYALGVETPSEVLVHMRLVAAARSDDHHAAVHVVKLESPTLPYRNYAGRDIKLVTISCSDRRGLLEYVTGKLLATGGSRVLDADVMTTSENIVLDRFVVEMNGRLRLDKLKQHIEDYLRKSERMNGELQHKPFISDVNGSSPVQCNHSALNLNNPVTPYGQIYHQHPKTNPLKHESISEKVETAVPLLEVLASGNPNFGCVGKSCKYLPPMLRSPYIRRRFSAPVAMATTSCQSSGESSGDGEIERSAITDTSPEFRGIANSAFTVVGNANGCDDSRSGIQRGLLDTLLRDAKPQVPNIPLDELMLTDNLGSGKKSTVYRAIWQKRSNNQGEISLYEVALKVFPTDDPSNKLDNIAEFRREADIASSLHNFNICKVVGIVNDPDCSCLAYEYCEGGPLENLLSDTSRCYEYLPIALDIASGMAYLHSRNVIHRDLKPANILLTKNNRAKIADFGMSVANMGQELTAETGTYRWMAPEVIRHESYSSNADVYSFGVVLWQLISREVPFSKLTPVQTAYAVAEGCRPEIPSSTPDPLRKIILACWDADTEKRPSFTYIAMALADYAKMAFSPANVGAQTVQIADEMLANVSGNSTVNVDFSVPMITARERSDAGGTYKSDLALNRSVNDLRQRTLLDRSSGSYSSIVGLPI